MDPSENEINSERNNNPLGYTTENSDSTQKVCRICYGGEAKNISKKISITKNQACIPRRT